MKAHILSIYAMNLKYARGLVDDVADDRMAEQPAPSVNHPAWVLGHLALTTDFMASLLDLDSHCPPAWRDLFGGGTQPKPDRALYPDKATLLDTLAAGHERNAEAFTAFDPARMDEPIGNPRMAKRLPTVGAWLIFGMGHHEMLHLGQLSAWRRVLGLPGVM